MRLQNFLVLLVLVGGCSSGAEQEQKAKARHEDDLRRIKASLLDDSLIPALLMGQISLAGGPPSLDALPDAWLSLVLLALNPKPTAVEAETFTWDTDDLTKAVDVLKKNSTSRTSFLQPDFITAMDADIKLGKAVGTITFRAEGLYHGKIEFTAHLGSDRWRVDEFRLPGYQLRVTHEGNEQVGHWKVSKL